MSRRRFALLADAANDVRAAVARARARRRSASAGPPSAEGAPDPETTDELSRRLDETRERLKRETPPRDDV